MSASTMMSLRLSNPIDCHKHGIPHSHPVRLPRTRARGHYLEIHFFGRCHYEPKTPRPPLRFQCGQAIALTENRLDLRSRVDTRNRDITPLILVGGSASNY